MATFYLGSKLSWQQYLQASSFVKDIQGQIRHGSQKQHIAITAQTREIIASREAMTKKFGEGFDAMTGTLDRGLADVTEAINESTNAIESLHSTFEYNLALIIEQMQLQSQAMMGMLQQMEAVHATLKSPTMTQAREFYQIGCDRLQKGLPDKALEALLESAKRDDANFMTQLMIGKLYLYGVTTDCNVVNLGKAEQHLMAAARYARAEVPRLPDANRYLGEALLHASIASYAQANDHQLNGNKDEAARLLQLSVDLAQQAREANPQLSEGHYHHAKYSALLGDGRAAAESLEKAVAMDENYCIKADGDRDFRYVRHEINDLFVRMRTESGDDVQQKVRHVERLLSDWIYSTNDAKVSASQINQLLVEAKQCLERNTYFDNRDAKQLLHQAEQIFHSLLVHKFALHALSAHLGRVSAMAFSPDESILASGGADHTVRLWNLSSNQLLLTLKEHEDTIVDLVFSHDSQILASVDKRGGVKLWDVKHGRCYVTVMEPGNPIQCLCFSPDDTILAIGGYNRQATLWDTHDGSLIQTFAAHKSSVDTVVFSHDGRLLATGSPDNSAILWDLTRGAILQTFFGCSGLANCVAFSADDRLLITGANDGSVRFYETQTGRLAHTLPERSGSVSWLTLSPDQRVLATINHGIAVQLWDIVHGKQLFELKPFSSGVTSLHFSPDGTVLTANDYQDRSVKLWNVRDGKLMHVIAGNLTCSAFNPDGTTLVTGDETGSLRFWGRMVMTRAAYEVQQQKHQAQTTAKPARKAGWITEATGASSRRAQTRVAAEPPPEQHFAARASSRIDPAPNVRPGHSAPNTGSGHSPAEPAPRAMDSERSTSAAAYSPPPVKPVREGRTAETSFSRRTAAEAEPDPSPAEHVRFQSPNPPEADPNVHASPRRSTTRLRETTPLAMPTPEPFWDTETRGSNGRTRVRKTGRNATKDSIRSSQIHDAPGEGRSTGSRRKQHPKGTCLVCGQPLGLWAKMCGIKLCKEHYF
ncbi:MAG: hypothetical protein ACREOO_20170 [bacterium]